MTTGLIIAAAVIHGLMYVNAVFNLVYLRRKQGTARVAGDVFLSILIPARNEEKNLPRLLASLREQDYGNYEVVIYDDQSEDGTWDLIQAEKNQAVSGVRGTSLPDGWVGKVNACCQLARRARGEVFLFLDSDTELLDPGALGRIVAVFQAHPKGSVVTGITRLRGGGELLVSMVGNMILAGMPWWLGRSVPASTMTGLNGQCWMIGAELYRQLEPHEYVKGEVLEDILIGRYLYRNGIVPQLCDLQNELAVYMYDDLAGAWRGFRKNASEMMGKSLIGASLRLLVYVFMFIVAPIVAPVFLLSLYGLKWITDRTTHMAPWITLLAPVSFFLAAVLTADSIVSRNRNRLVWKGRSVMSAHVPGTNDVVSSVTGP